MNISYCAGIACIIAAIAQFAKGEIVLSMSLVCLGASQFYMGKSKND